MQRKKFDEIDEESLFWIAESETPNTPYELHGPYKKKIFQEFSKNPPKFIFVKRKELSLAELILSQKIHPPADRPQGPAQL